MFIRPGQAKSDNSFQTTTIAPRSGFIRSSNQEIVNNTNSILAQPKQSAPAPLKFDLNKALAEQQDYENYDKSLSKEMDKIKNTWGHNEKADYYFNVIAPKLDAKYKSYKYLNTPEFKKYQEEQVQAEKNKGNAIQRFGSRVMDTAMVTSSPEGGHQNDIKANTGNKIANFVADAIGTIAGYATPTGLGNSMLGLTNKAGEKVAEKVIPKAVATAEKASLKNVILRNVIEGAATTTPLSIADANKEKMTTGEKVKKVAIDTAMGAGLGAGVGLLGKSFSMLKNAIKKPVQEAATAETISIEKIVKPKTAPGKMKLANPEFDSAMKEYNDAIETIQNHFKTSELRSDEIPLIKSELGIDLDSIMTKLEKSQNKELLTADQLKTRRAAGVNSNQSDSILKKVAKQDSNLSSMNQELKDLEKEYKLNVESAKNARFPSDLKEQNIKRLNEEYLADKEEILNKNKNVGPEQIKTTTQATTEKAQPVNVKTTKYGTSKFAETVKKADTTDPEFAQTVRPPEYQKVENQATWDSAVEKVNSNSDEVYSNIINKSEKETFSHQDTADAMALIDKFSKDGKYNQANEVLEKTTLKLTKAGQAIQAASMWARQTPTGMLKYAENVMSKVRKAITDNDPELKALNDEIISLKSKIDEMKSNKAAKVSEAKTATGSRKKTLTKEIFDLDNQMKINLQLFAEKEAKLPAKLKNVKLTDKDLEHIYKEQTEIGKMAEGRAKTVRVAKLQSYIAYKVPSSVLQKISTIQTMAQLMNFKTAIRNTVGNAGFMTVENVSDALATGFDTVLSKITGIKTKAFGLDTVKAQGRGLKKGFIAGLDDAKQGIDTSGFRTQHDLPNQTFKGTFKNTQALLESKEYKKAVGEGISSILGTLEKGMQIELKATDRAFYQAAFNKTIAEQMRVQGIKSLDKITPEIIEMAHLDGLYRTFQDKNILSDAFSAVKRALNGGKEFGVGDLILKYPKTPANLLMRGIDYSPIALVRSFIQLAKISTKVVGGKAVTPQLQKQFVEGLARGTIGSGLFFGVGALYNLGIVQGKRPKDKEAADLLKEVGQGQYTINLSALTRWVSSGFNAKAAKSQNGDHSISYDWMQPTALTMAAGANRGEQMKEKNKVNPLDLIGAITYSLESGVDTMAEQPLVQGIAKLFQGYGKTSDAIASVFQSAPSSFIPTFVNQVKQIVDNKSRNLENGGNYGLNKAVNLVINKIPGLSSMLPEQVTTTGKTKETYQNGSNSLVNVLFNPAFTSTLKKTSGIKLVLDLYSKTGDVKQFPREAAKYITINGKRLNLTTDQRKDLQKFIAKQTLDQLNELSRDKEFDKLTSTEKIDYIGSILDNSGKNGRSYLINKLSNKYLDENLK